MIQVLGIAERAAINVEYKSMLKKLCEARSDGAYCLDMEGANKMIGEQLNSMLKTLPLNDKN